MASAFSKDGSFFGSSIDCDRSFGMASSMMPDGDILVTKRGVTYIFPNRYSRDLGTNIAASGAILSPMPGKVTAVDVSLGAAVTKGQRLLTLEAMKMEHALTAPFDGTVAELNVAEGQQVQVDAVLARIEPAAGSE